MSDAGTRYELRSDAIEKLQQIIRANVDSGDGLEEAASKIKETTLANLFRDIAIQRTAHADELARMVRSNGVGPRRRGSGKAALHRFFVDFRAALNVGDPPAVLAEAQRGEDYIMHLYEGALEELSGSAAYDVLQRQHLEVKQSYDRIRNVRDDRTNR